MDDSRIIELFFERSEQAISALSEKYGAVCSKIANHILNDRRDAEECVNDAYLGVWNTIPPKTPHPLLTYVCKIVRNLAIKKYHSNTAVKRNSQYDMALDELESCIPSAASVEDACDSKALAGMLDAFLEGLDQENRILFVRRYWYSESVGELADHFRMSSHAVTVRLSRIRKNLKKFLEQRGVSV